MTHSSWNNKTQFYFWLCVTFRALLFLSVVMIQLSSVFPPQAPVNTDTDTLEEQKQDTHTLKKGKLSHVTQDIVLFWSISGLTFTIRSQDSQSCTIKKRRTRRLFMLLQKRSLIKLCGLIWKEEEVLKATCLFLLAGIVRRKLSCVCPLVAQSRCPNQFPPHFLLSTQYQRFKAFIVKTSNGGPGGYFYMISFSLLNIKNHCKNETQSETKAEILTH